MKVGYMEKFVCMIKAEERRTLEEKRFQERQKKYREKEKERDK